LRSEGFLKGIKTTKIQGGLVLMEQEIKKPLVILLWLLVIVAGIFCLIMVTGGLMGLFM